MIYWERQPGAELRPWVRMLWYARATDCAFQRERILPTGHAQILVSLARDFIADCQEGQPDSRMAPALVAGQRSIYEIADTADMADLIGIVFAPGALPVFLADAADRVTNCHVALEDVCRSGRGLRERLQDASGPYEKLRCLECFLRERLAERWGTTLHPAVEFALEEFGRAPSMARVPEVAWETGWSERRFSQIFREEVGFSPKVWCRIQRFQRVVRQLHRGDEVTWPELALECGFYDQSHLANEFRAFSGISPTGYTAVPEKRWVNHLRVG